MKPSAAVKRSGMRLGGFFSRLRFVESATT